MNKILLVLTLIVSPLFLLFLTATSIHAQTSQLNSNSNNHTAREEQEGKEIWEKLQAKQLECGILTDDNYGSLGEYFMGRMIGSSHETMNNMMIQMMGKQGEEQMHIVMGKRLSGCDTNAEIPQSGVGFIPMMWMMQGGGNPMMSYSGWGNMMNSWGGFSSLLFNLSLIVWLVVGILAAVWLFRQISKK